VFACTGLTSVKTIAGPLGWLGYVPDCIFTSFFSCSKTNWPTIADSINFLKLKLNYTKKNGLDA